MEYGIIFNAGRIANREVDLTTNLIEQLDKREIARAIVEGLDLARHFRQPDMKEIVVNGKRVWVDDNGSIITLIFLIFSCCLFFFIFLCLAQHKKPPSPVRRLPVEKPLRR